MTSQIDQRLFKDGDPKQVMTVLQRCAASRLDSDDRQMLHLSTAETDE